MKIFNLKYTFLICTILFAYTGLVANAQIQDEALKKLEGNWVVIKKHKTKHKNGYKVESKATNYTSLDSDKIIYNFQAPNKLSITEIDSKNGKQETEIDHYKIKKLDSSTLEVEKLNDDDLIKDKIKATWEINKNGYLDLIFKSKKAFSNTTRTRIVTLKKEN